MDEEQVNGNGLVENEFEDDDEELIEVIELDGEGEENDENEESMGDGADFNVDMGDGEGSVTEEGPVSDDAQIVFTEHKGSVFCVDVDPDSRLAITGGEDDLAYLWDLASGTVCFKCSGHKDSVVAAAFNRNGRYVASADMSGLVQVWSTESGNLVWSAECSDLEWLAWHHLTDALLAGTTDGTVWMWLVPAGACKIYQGPDCPCACGKVTPDGKLLVAGYADGSVRVWDLKAASVTFSTSGQELHGGPLTSLDVHRDNNLVVTSSTDATSKLISIGSKKVIRTVDCTMAKPAEVPAPAPGATDTEAEMADDDEASDADAGPADGLECVRFCPTFPYVAMGSIDGRLSIWDLNSDSVRCTCEHQAGIVSCVWDLNEPLVYTCTLDGALHQWDARTGTRLKQWFGHRAEILSLVLTRDGDRLVSTSDDNTARVFSIGSVQR